MHEQPSSIIFLRWNALDVEDAFVAFSCLSKRGMVGIDGEEGRGKKCELVSRVVRSGKFVSCRWVGVVMIVTF